MQLSASEMLGLLEQARTGDQSAFARLFDRHRQLLRLVLRSQMSAALRKKADSSDLLQETFITASQSLGEFRGRDMAAFVRWLEVIATRRMVDAYRRYVEAEKRAVDREVSLEQLMAQADRSTDRLANLLPASGGSPSQAARNGELILALADAMSRLPRDYQRAIELRFLREESIDAIAAEMDRSKGAVAMLLARGVERLRDMLRRDGWDEFSRSKGKRVSPP